MSDNISNIIPLSCVCQNYAWGKMGDTSAVAKLAFLNKDIQIDQSQPYAEYWFGTHKKGPATIKKNEKQLSDVVGELPYLLKVLSIAKCLSIQAHPNKKLAEQLHGDRPEVYKDPNHKPEMTIAITPFEAMCQFRNVQEIVQHVDAVPEFKQVIGEAGVAASIELKKETLTDSEKKKYLKDLFTSYSKADADMVKALVTKLIERVDGDHDKDTNNNVRKVENVALRLAAQFPGDIGVFAPFLLNVITLNPGDAVFLAANEPHAYISGDCVEVMACSDNVVRMGCTPKLRDTSVLVDMLTYNNGMPKIMKGEMLDALTRIYIPWDEAVTEFQIEYTDFNLSDNGDTAIEYTLRPFKGPSLLLILQGNGKTTDSNGDVIKFGKNGDGCIFYLNDPSNGLKIIEEKGDERLIIVRACERR